MSCVFIYKAVDVNRHFHRFKTPTYLHMQVVTNPNAVDKQNLWMHQYGIAQM